MNGKRPRIYDAVSAQDIAACRNLFKEYAAWLNFDLCFQGFDKELLSLPGAYAAPRGRLLLAGVDGAPIGCVALRPMGDDVCEMKRLYVRDACRGSGAGRALAERAISEARLIGYREMRLDTLPQMEAAISLYRSLGFVGCESYHDTPLRNTIFMQLDLA